MLQSLCTKFIFHKAQKFFNSLLCFHRTLYDQICDFPENIEGLKSESTPGFFDRWFELLHWIILLLVDILWEDSVDVLHWIEIRTAYYTSQLIHHTNILIAKPHLCNVKCVLMRCPAETSSRYHLGVHQTARNEDSKFPENFVNFLCHFRNRQTFLHCSQKRLIPWASHHVVAY